MREMREDHHEIQTPKKEQLSVSSNRKAKLLNAPSKKLHHQQQKSTKRNLTSVFTPISEGDTVLDASKESIEKISAISEAVDADHSIISNMSFNSDNTLVSENPVALQLLQESPITTPISEVFVLNEDQSSIKSYIMSLNHFISSSVKPHSVEATPLSLISPVQTTPLSSIPTIEITPSSSLISTDDAAGLISSVTNDGATAEETNSINREILVEHLTEGMFQVLHSSDIDSQYKKLLDELVKMVIEEFCSFSLNEERVLVVELFSRKVKILLLSYFLGLLVVSAGFALFSNVQSSYRGPPPT